MNRRRRVKASLYVREETSVAMSSGHWEVAGWSGWKGIGCSFQEYQEVKGRKQENSHVNTRN